MKESNQLFGVCRWINICFPFIEGFRLFLHKCRESIIKFNPLKGASFSSYIFYLVYFLSILLDIRIVECFMGTIGYKKFIRNSKCIDVM